MSAKANQSGGAKMGYIGVESRNQRYLPGFALGSTRTVLAWRGLQSVDWIWKRLWGRPTECC